MTRAERERTELTISNEQAILLKSASTLCVCTALVPDAESDFDRWKSFQFLLLLDATRRVLSARRSMA